MRKEATPARFGRIAPLAAGMIVKRFAIFAAATFLLSPSGAASQITSFPLTMPDGLGGTITVRRQPTRIISLAPNVTEILFAIGAGDRVVGVTRFCNYPAEAKSRTKVGGYTDISLEVILALKPDLIVASRGNPRANLLKLKQHGLTVLGIDAQSIDEVMDAILLVGRATGCDRGAERVSRRMRRIVEAVRKALAGVKVRPRVYFGSLKAPYFAAGTNSFIGRCIETAGGENIARGPREPWPILSMETIIRRDPEVIIAGFHQKVGGENPRRKILERLRANRVWSQIAAVRTGRVYVMNEDAVHRAGPRIARVVAEMARLFHPERFPSDGPKKPE